MTAVGRGHQVPFVGRRTELEQLEHLWERSRRSRPSFVVVEGEAGIGKTRLASEFADRARRGGARLLWGNCIDLQERGLPYAPFRQALRDTADDPGLRSAMASASSELTDLLTGPDELTTAEHTQSRRIGLFEAVLRLFHDIAASRPLLIVVEDVHWADHTTLDLLTFLSHNLGAIPALGVLTYRPQAAADADRRGGAVEDRRNQAVRNFLFGHAGGAITDRLRLEAFGEREVAEQVAQLVDEDHRPADVTEIARRSNGNPLFVEELVASDVAGDTQLSPSLRQLLQRRVGGLPVEVREVLEIAAVGGQTVEYALLRAVADLPRDLLRTRLREAVAKGVLFDEPDGDAYTFRHALVQEALYEDLPADRKRELHRRFADVLVARQRHQLAAPGAIARHWDNANEHARALRAYLQAAEAARATFGFVDAERFLRRAYELWEQVDDPEALTSMTWRRLANIVIDSALRIEQPASVTGVAEAALRQARETRDLHVIAYQRSQLGTVHWYAGDEQLGLNEIRASVASLDAEEPSREQGRVFALCASTLAICGRYREAAALGERALDVAVRTGAPGVYRNTLVVLGSVAARLGDLDRGTALLDEAEELARLRNDADEVMRIVLHRGRVLQAYARWGEACRVYQDGLVAAPKYGMHLRYSWRFHVLAARMSFVQGDWAQADAELAHARDLVASPHDAVLPSLLVATGRFAEADEVFDGRRSRWRSEGTGLAQLPEVPVDLAAWRGDVDAARERCDAARDLLVDSQECAPEARLCLAGLRVEADAAARTSDDPASGSERAVTLRDRLHELTAAQPARSDGFGQEVAMLAALGDAEHARAVGAPDPDAWAAAAERCDALGVPYPAAYARWRQAQALRHHGGDRRAAAELVATALAEADRLGARPLTSAIRGVAPHDVTDIGDDPRAGLTEREHEVADLLVEGCSNRQIAERLGITEGTASVHVSNLLRKLGVTSRTAAAAVLLRGAR